ncbi:MAG: LOG family protein [bacterium]
MRDPLERPERDTLGPYCPLEPSPYSQPKPAEDDPGAPDRTRAIVSDPSYRRAFEDHDFLEEDETRQFRLALDYLKPELRLRAHGIESTIVVFGGTRVVEEAEAKRRLETARRALAEHPEDTTRRRAVAIAENVLAKAKYYDAARDFARIASEASRPDERGRRQWVIVTGGGPGVMEAGNRGAFDAGAPSIGLNITLPHEQFPNPYITPGLAFQFAYFAIRKMHFAMRARALVAFPGGFGTFDELFEMLTLIQTGKLPHLPVILVGESFWRKAFDAEHLAAEGVIAPDDVSLFQFAETGGEAWDKIRRWYHARGVHVDGSPDGAGGYGAVAP